MSCFALARCGWPVASAWLALYSLPYRVYAGMPSLFSFARARSTVALVCLFVPGSEVPSALLAPSVCLAPAGFLAAAWGCLTSS